MINHSREFHKGKLEGYNEAWELMKVLLPADYTLKPVKMRHRIAVLECKLRRIGRESKGTKSAMSVERFKYPRQED